MEQLQLLAWSNFSCIRHQRRAPPGALFLAIENGDELKGLEVLESATFERKVAVLAS